MLNKLKMLLWKNFLYGICLSYMWLIWFTRQYISPVNYTATEKVLILKSTKLLFCLYTER